MSPFRYGRDPLCLTSCALYALNRWAVKPHVHSRFLHGHFNDLLLIPAALPLLLWVQRWLGWRHHDGAPTAGEILAHLAVWSVLFEAVGPRIMRVTADPMDVVAYGIGGLVAGLCWHWFRRRRSPVA